MNEHFTDFSGVFFLLSVFIVISAVNIVLNMNISRFPCSSTNMYSSPDECCFFLPYDHTKSFNMRVVSFSVSDKVANHGIHPRISLYQFQTIQIFNFLSYFGEFHFKRYTMPHSTSYSI